MSAGRSINTKSQSWGTPKKYVEAVKKFFGGSISLDPCSNEYSIVNADTEFRLPNNNGLHEKWNYPTIYVNPPYGIDKESGTSIKNWLSKCAFAFEEYNAEVIALVPVATNTGHWKKFVYGKAISICFLYDTRLKFLENGKDTGKGAPMSCCIIYWGKNYQRFFDCFIKYGAVINIENLIGQKIAMEKKELNLEFEIQITNS